MSDEVYERMRRRVQTISALTHNAMRGGCHQNVVCERCYARMSRPVEGYTCVFVVLDRFVLPNLRNFDYAVQGWGDRLPTEEATRAAIKWRIDTLNSLDDGDCVDCACVQCPAYLSKGVLGNTCLLLVLGSMLRLCKIQP